ncbi:MULTISPECIES: cytochrome c oxidase assembly protein [unclassified Corynebacterium]|uniref:cytochrome c oxidase assembly protein n=1 Tax=unclassified Corynebacterium TaxID=2624378 RepID=UPI000831E589|nr:MULTISPECIES: cytochrome c oxidase assembly protein [unclassified Corynebacterium]OFL80325.1 copper resistance protein [Corynebacterium sp. HMSC077B05]
MRHMSEEQLSSQDGDGFAVASAPAARRRARGSAWIYVCIAIVAGIAAGGIASFFLADSLKALGIPDPGRVTTVGLPFVRAAAWIAMATSVGSFLASSFFISPREHDAETLNTAPLTVDGHVAKRVGALAALVTAVLAVLEVPLVLSDTTGSSFLEVLDPQLFTYAFPNISTAQVWLLTAGLAAVVGIGGLIASRWGSQPVLLVLSVLMVVPLGMEGHSASGGDHDYGTNSFLWHLIFMVLWVGGLLALLAHGRRLGPDLTMAVRRYSNLALFSVIVMVCSGLINAAIRIEWSDWFTTRYGLIIVAKSVLTLVLALFGFAHRQLTMPQLKSRPELFRRVAFVELLVMALTVGVAGTMGRTPPPPPRDPNLNSMQILLGYELSEAPSVAGLFTHFRFDILWGTLGLLLAGFYAYGVWRVRRRGLTWTWTRTAWWMAGSLGMTLFMSSELGMYIPALYSMHMLGHMVLSMVVPLLLALGAPLTLMMEAWEPGFGPHEWALAATRSRIVGFITHPAVNLVQFLFFFYILYLSFDLYEYAVSEHAGHVIMNACFLVSGYFYFWELVGPDPIPHRRPTGLRLLLLFISMPIHLYAGVYLMQLGQILGENFYLSLDLPWNPDFAYDQKVGGGIAWGFGQFPLVIVFGTLFLEWLREDRSAARRHDQKADLDGDQDLEDYNAMLARLNDEDYR